MGSPTGFNRVGTLVIDDGGRVCGDETRLRGADDGKAGEEKDEMTTCNGVAILRSCEHLVGKTETIPKWEGRGRRDFLYGGIYTQIYNSELGDICDERENLLRRWEFERLT